LTRRRLFLAPRKLLRVDASQPAFRPGYVANLCSIDVVAVYSTALLARVPFLVLQVLQTPQKCQVRRLDEKGCL
jgi:hypothetical protein